MRVLVVEDQRKIAAFIERGLTEEGYAVDVVTDGNEALDFVESAPYDLVVLGIRLPKRDGLSTCRELHARGNRVPILMLTARDTVEDRAAGFDCGAPMNAPALSCRSRTSRSIRLAMKSAEVIPLSRWRLRSMRFSSTYYNALGRLQRAQ